VLRDSQQSIGALPALTIVLIVHHTLSPTDYRLSSDLARPCGRLSTSIAPCMSQAQPTLPHPPELNRLGGRGQSRGARI